MDDENSTPSRPQVRGSLPGKRLVAGRPRLIENGRAVNVELPSDLYSQLMKRAARENITISELCRLLLAEGLKGRHKMRFNS